MNDSADGPEAQPPEAQPSAARGEAAWKEAKARVAERNERVRKEGRARRDAYEADKNAARRMRERREITDLLDERGKR